MSILPPMKTNRPKATQVTVVVMIADALLPPEESTKTSISSKRRNPINGMKPCKNPKVPAMKRFRFLLRSTIVSPEMMETAKASIDKAMPKRMIWEMICQVMD